MLFIAGATFLWTGSLYALDIEEPAGEVTYPDLQIFNEKNYYYINKDFSSDENIVVSSRGTLDFNGSSATLSGVILNNSALKFTNTASTGVAISYTANPGNVWVDKNALILVGGEEATSSEVTFSTLAGAGTVKNISSSPVTNITTVLSPSYWNRATVTYLDESGQKTGTVIPAASSGSTLTITATDTESHVVNFGEDSILAPYIFKNEAASQNDFIKIDGTATFTEGAYIQAMLSEPVQDAIRDGSYVPSTSKLTVLSANQITHSGKVQNYVWGDMTPETFSETNNYSDPDGICCPLLYRVSYDGGDVTLTEQFHWTGNYEKLLLSGSGTPVVSLKDTASIFNELMFEGTTTDTYDDDQKKLYYTSDLGILRTVAQTETAESAAKIMRQMSPELYYAQFSIVALNGLNQAESALEQMSTGRQFNGLRSRIGSCTSKENKVSEKREHYDPFLAQFEGNSSWYAWATGTGEWLNRDTGNLLSGNLGYKYNDYGINAGLARNLGNVTLGLSVGWQNGTFEGKDFYHETEMNSFQAMILGAWYLDNWWADGWFGYQHSSDSTKRETYSWYTGNTIFANTDYSVQGWNGGFNLGYQWRFKKLSILPSIGFHFSTARNDAIWEAASLLDISETKRGLYEVPIGVRFISCFDTESGWLFVPMLKAEWISRFGDTGDEYLSYSYGYMGDEEHTTKPTGLNSNGYMIGTTSAEIKSEFHANLRLNMMKNRWTFGVEYDGSFADSYNAHRAGGNFGFVF